MNKTIELKYFRIDQTNCEKKATAILTTSLGAIEILPLGWDLGNGTILLVSASPIANLGASAVDAVPSVRRLLSKPVLLLLEKIWESGE